MNYDVQLTCECVCAFIQRNGHEKKDVALFCNYSVVLWGTLLTRCRPRPISDAVNAGQAGATLPAVLLTTFSLKPVLPFSLHDEEHSLTSSISPPAHLRML